MRCNLINANSRSKPLPYDYQSNSDKHTTFVGVGALDDPFMYVYFRWICTQKSKFYIVRAIRESPLPITNQIRINTPHFVGDDVLGVPFIYIPSAFCGRFVNRPYRQKRTSGKPEALNEYVIIEHYGAHQFLSVSIAIPSQLKKTI